MSTIMANFPAMGSPSVFLEIPVAQLAQTFWMAFVSSEENRRRELEAHAFTAWWTHLGIEFEDGVKHHTWVEWLDMRGLRWGAKQKSREELVAEINSKWDKVFHPNVRFESVEIDDGAPDPEDKEAMRDWLSAQRGIVEG